MSDQVDQALRHPLVRGARRLVAEYAFSLGDLPTQIRLRVYESLGKSGVEVEQSHHIQTPLQQSPNFGEDVDYKDAADAVRTTVDQLVEHYQAAVDAGHRPDPDWLFPNRYFD